MKKLLLLLIVPMISFGQAETAAMTFDKTIHDFGGVMEGDVVMTTFKFTNTGGTSLYIVDARGSCECIKVVNYPKNTPIGPGETGKISVSFDSNNKPNLQQKTVTISANTSSGREVIRIKANVNPDPRKQKQRRDVSNQNQRQSRDAAADGYLTYKVGNDTYKLPKERVAELLNKYPNAVPYYESKEKSGQVQTFEKQKKEVLKEDTGYQGIGLPQIILIGIIAIPLVLVILYFTKSTTRKTNIQHSATVETPPQVEVRSSFCVNCGKSINKKTAFCTSCGSKIK